MANPEHLAILKQGVEQWNAWREERRDVVPDLSGADLRKASPIRANLSRAKLSQALLNDADLIGASLIRADLSRANLCGADLIAADLRRANLGEARLIWANLRGTALGETNFARAIVGETNFCDVDLSPAKGLETVVHGGPSTIGIDTIYKSQGKIPEVFLRGCGVPEEFIRYIGSMVGRPIEFYSCFISYSTKDQEFADRLYADLQNKGVRCWFAPHDIQGGRKLHEQIDEAIRLHDKLLLILSEHSMNSEWVKTEILRAQKREVEENREKAPLIPTDGMSGAPDQDPVKKPKRVLFPITLVPYAKLETWEYPISTGIDLAEEIRQYFIPDFSSWKEHDSYQKEFERLVGDLKAESKSAAG